MTSVFEKLKAEQSSMLDELKRRSNVEKKKRLDAGKKVKEVSKARRLQKEQRNQLERQDELERQRRQSKLSADLSVSLKKVVDHLTEVKDDVSLDEAWRRLSLKGNRAKLIDVLKKNRFVEVIDGRAAGAPKAGVVLRYRAKFPHVRSRADVVDFLTQRWQKPADPESGEGCGVSLEDVADCYRNARADVEELLRQGRIYAITHQASREKLLFCPPLPMETPLGSRKEDGDANSVSRIDESLVGLWNDTALPSKEALEDELRACGIKPAWQNTRVRKLSVKKTKKKPKQRDFRFAKVTNVHMPELFQTKQPEKWA